MSGGQSMKMKNLFYHENIISIPAVGRKSEVSELLVALNFCEHIQAVLLNREL